MFCGNCGKQLSDNSKFCPGCGAKQDVQNEVPVQTTVNPVGQPFGLSNQAIESGEKNSKLKKHLPIIIAVAIAVVAIAVAVTLFFVLDDDSKSERSGKEISSDSGAKSVVNRFIDAVNDYDAEETVECFAYSQFLDEDDLDDAIEGTEDDFDDLKDADFEIDVEFKSEKYITDDDCDECDDDMTWKEYYQESFEETDNYDDQEVEAVKEFRVNITCDYDKDYKDDVERIAEYFEYTERFICIKIDGDWYILDNFFSYGLKIIYLKP